MILKKIFVFIVCMLFATISFSEITMVNESKMYDVEVNYKFCKDTEHPTFKRECSPVITATVKSEKDVKQKNYFVTSAPNDSSVILIMSAAEKDDSGNVIAYGSYAFSQTFDSSDCGMYLVAHDVLGKVIRKNVVISLDDLGQTPVIMCKAGIY